ncbi:MAG: HD domain-containing protein [Candidatus Thiodiazotropha sp. (ex Epidulcina cf. delphinae)]|nr:HD domain-containing protein [Candidatus Thiodiazotropha sp. (ex Epidulcina cf. delphinae)]
METNISKDILRGRITEREEDLRGAYLRDQTAIVHSMAFRRLKHKTQVFFDPDNDHVCTRIEHVMHVATIAATICKGINRNGGNLNEELATVIGLGHDIGHAPFGHAGESTLNELLGNPDEFIHEVNGLRVVDYLANDGNGLNLTYAVRDGIVCHNGEEFEQQIEPRDDAIDLRSIKNRSQYPISYEACIVRMSDKIAYLGRDIEDALTASIIGIKDLPKLLKEKADIINSHLINELVVDVVNTSSIKGKIALSDKAYELITAMRNFNYDVIYKSAVLKEYMVYCTKIIKMLFEYILELYNKNGTEIDRYLKGSSILEIRFGKYMEKMKDAYINAGTAPNLIVADYISGMTDKYALECMKQITIPKPISFVPHLP